MRRDADGENRSGDVQRDGRSPRSWEERMSRSGLIVGNLGEGGGLGSFDTLDFGVSCMVLGRWRTSTRYVSQR